MGKFVATQETTDRSFASVIRELEQSDSSGRKMTIESYRIGEVLFDNKAFCPVKIFNWLSDTQIREHEKGGFTYIEIVPNDRNLKIITTFKQVFLNNGFGFLCLKATNAKGVFIRKDGKPIWQYPEYSKRVVNPFDVQAVIKSASKSMAWGE